MEYYIKINEEKRGPYSLNELAERKLDETSLVMPTDGVEWVPANQIEELRTLFESKDSTDNPVKTEDVPFVEARPIIQAAPQEAAQQAQPAPKKKSHTGCLIGILLTLVVLVAVMVVTCPKTEQHKEVLSTVITTTVNDAVNDNDNITGNTFIDNAFKTISNAFAGKVIETAVDNLVTVDNYVVCSLGKVHYDGKDHIVSLGIFGHIFTVDEDDLQEAAERYYKKEEINLKEQLRKKAQKMLQENIIAPAASAIEGLLGSAMDGLLDEIGLDTHSSKSSGNKYLEADSI
nr:GYF domain-containing protein [uncultured Prevotella sp.]